MTLTFRAAVLLDTNCPRRSICDALLRRGGLCIDITNLMSSCRPPCAPPGVTSPTKNRWAPVPALDALSDADPIKEESSVRTIDIHAHLVPQSLWKAVDAQAEWYGFRQEAGDKLA